MTAPRFRVFVSLLSFTLACGYDFAATAPVRVVVHDAGETPPRHDGGVEPDGGADCEKPCDDGEPCNGLEHCVRGHCQPGSQPCQTTDPQHCEASCKAHAGKPQCSTVARDRDHDGYGDAACTLASARGNDCDDDHATAHPGATEQCDGLDNDCNGKVDHEDGLAWQEDDARNALIKGEAGRAAWAGPSQFGIAYLLDGALTFASLDQNGIELFEHVFVERAAGDAGVSTLRYAIDTDQHQFAIAWASEHELGMRLVQKNGTVKDTIDLLPQQQDGFGAVHISYLSAANEWFVIYECCDPKPGLWARHVSADGSVLPALQALVPATVASFAAAVVDTRLIVTWLEPDQKSNKRRILWQRFTAQGASQDAAAHVLAEVSSTNDLSAPLIAATSDRFAIVWTERSLDTPSHPHYAEFAGDGSMLCALDLATVGSPAALPLTPISMAYANGRFVLIGSVTGSNAQDIVELRPSCQYVQRFQVLGAVNTGNVVRDQFLTSAGSRGGLILYTSGQGAIQTDISWVPFDSQICQK